MFKLIRSVVLALAACAFVLLEPTESSALQDYCSAFDFTSECIPVYPGGLCNPDVYEYCNARRQLFPTPWQYLCQVKMGSFGSNCLNGWGSGCMAEDYRYECKYVYGGSPAPVAGS